MDDTRTNGPHSRRRRLWLPLALAAVLLLSACGQEKAAADQFARWFWTLADDPGAPEASGELLADLGTVIGQSQTADGVTVTLNGAVWDGNRLVLSLSLEGEGLDAAYSNQVHSPDSWLEPPRDATEADLRETLPNISEDDLQAFLDDYYGPDTRAFRPISIDYLYDRKTGERWLQVDGSSSPISEADRQELTLHLEDLSFGNTVVKGPFDFTFTVERRQQLDRVYTGDTVIQPEEGPALRITGVTVSPFRVEAGYETVDPAPSGRHVLQMDRLRVDGQEISPTGQGGGSRIRHREDGRLEGSMWAGLFDRPVDPATVEAVELCGVWVELGELELTEPAEP